MVKVDSAVFTASRFPSKVTDALPFPTGAVTPVNVNDTVLPAGTDTVTVIVSFLSKWATEMGSPAPTVSMRDALPVVAVFPVML